MKEWMEVQVQVQMSTTAFLKDWPYLVNNYITVMKLSD